MGHRAQFSTSYFKVKDPEDFKRFCRHLDAHWDTKEDLVRLYRDSRIPSELYDYKTDTEIDFLDMLAELMTPGQVMVLMETGFAGMGDLSAQACILESDGSRQWVDLVEIAMGWAQSTGKEFMQRRQVA